MRFSAYCWLLLISLPLALSAQTSVSEQAIENFNLDSFAQKPHVWLVHKDNLLKDDHLPEKRFTKSLLDALQIACAAGDLATVKHCLKAGCSPRRSNYFTPFSLAIALHYNQADIVRHLVEHDSSLVQYRSKAGHNALFIGDSTRLDLIEYLIERGVDVNNPEGHSPMVLAATQVPRIELLLANGGDLNVKDSRGRRPLHFAAGFAESTAPLERLVEAGADLEALSDVNYSLLHYAAHFNEEVAITNWLLDKGADINARANRQFTPLHAAAENNPNPLIIEKLLAAGADLEAEDRYQFRPLHLAAKDNPNKAAVLSVLLKAGAELDAQNEFKDSPLDYAIQTPIQNDVVNDSLGLLTLLQAGAKINAKGTFGRTLLHKAVQSSRLAIVRTLIEQGANLEAQTNSNETPLLLSTYNPDWRVLALLVEKGANLHAQTKSGWTVWHYAVCHEFRPQMLRFLLTQNPNINVQDKYGYTPFLVAANHNDSVEVFRFLMENGANAHSKNENGAGALHLLADRNDKEHLEVARFLIEQGLDLEATDKAGYTPFLTAVLSCRSVPPLHFWVEQGANLQAQNHAGRNALHILAANIYLEEEPIKLKAADYLIGLGLDKQLKDKRGQRPAEVALEYKRFKLAELLSED